LLAVGVYGGHRTRKGRRSVLFADRDESAVFVDPSHVRNRAIGPPDCRDDLQC
jgi:hypothetical protein